MTWGRRAGGRQQQSSRAKNKNDPVFYKNTAMSLSMFLEPPSTCISPLCQLPCIHASMPPSQHFVIFDPPCGCASRGTPSAAWNWTEFFVWGIVYFRRVAFKYSQFCDMKGLSYAAQLCTSSSRVLERIHYDLLSHHDIDVVDVIKRKLLGFRQGAGSEI